MPPLMPLLPLLPTPLAVPALEPASALPARILTRPKKKKMCICGTGTHSEEQRCQFYSRRPDWGRLGPDYSHLDRPPNGSPPLLKPPRLRDPQPTSSRPHRGSPFHPRYLSLVLRPHGTRRMHVLRHPRTLPCRLCPALGQGGPRPPAPKGIQRRAGDKGSCTA
jgi:hypothetical protein